MVDKKRPSFWRDCVPLSKNKIKTTTSSVSVIIALYLNIDISVIQSHQNKVFLLSVTVFEHQLITSPIKIFINSEERIKTTK